MDEPAFFRWLREGRKTTIELRDEILTTSSLRESWNRILNLYIMCTFSGYYDAARRLLEAYFGCQPELKQSPRISYEQQILAMIWKHAESAKPQNIPWDVTISEGGQNAPEYDIGDPAFFQLDKWTDTDWIPDEIHRELGTRQRIGADYDPHQWKTSDDPWTHIICARLLCRVPEGEVADSASTREAFEAVDRLFLHLPRIDSSGQRGRRCHAFPMKVYFSLAVGLGKLERAREIFRLACTTEEWSAGELFPIPALYPIYFGEEGAAAPSIPDSGRLIAESDAAKIVDSLTTALIERKQAGGIRQEPLHGVAWPELLRRFSEAAFKVEQEGYAELEDDPPEEPSDILLPPITPDELAEVERGLGGPLPPDMREMALIANGFRGGWHFMGGGFPGVHELRFVPQVYGHEAYLDIGPEEPTRTETTTVANPDGTTQTLTTTTYDVSVGGSEAANNAGPVWECAGTEENDDFIHLICPPTTWRKLTEGRRKTEEGEYRVVHYSHWTDGGENYRSMRHWVASVTAGLERTLEIQDAEEHGHLGARG